MNNLDFQNEAWQNRADALVAAASGEDKGAFKQAFISFADAIQQQVLQEAQNEIQGIKQSNDANILNARGVRQLTGEESKYWQRAIEAMSTDKPSQALADLDVVMPQTIVNDVFEDLQTNHELLSVIDFIHGIGITEYLMNTNPTQLATWSPLCAEIVKELSSGFKSINVSQNKLSAFIPVCKAMLDLGPQWLDRYVRAIMVEALALGLEDGILNGRGQTDNIKEPVGMIKDLSGSISPTDGYPDKTPVPVTALDPVTYGDLLSTLSKTEKGNPRNVSGIIMVVNPVDYFRKIMPATTVMATSGTYVNNVLPYPTRIIQSSRMAEGRAVLGIPKRYLMISGSGKNGKLEYSDHYQFLEDARVYLTKFYGHGLPKDNNSFLYLDISGLQPANIKVEIIETV